MIDRDRPRELTGRERRAFAEERGGVLHELRPRAAARQISTVL